MGFSFGKWIWLQFQLKEDGTNSKYKYYVGKSCDLFDRKFRETWHLTKFMGRALSLGGVKTPLKGVIEA